MLKAWNFPDCALATCAYTAYALHAQYGFLTANHAVAHLVIFIVVLNHSKGSGCRLFGLGRGSCRSRDCIVTMVQWILRFASSVNSSVQKGTQLYSAVWSSHGDHS